MMVAIPEKVKKVIRQPNYAHVATLAPDGSPRVSVVAADVDGEYILVNARDDRLKVKDVQRDPRVAISIARHDDPLSWVRIRGRVVEIRPDPGGAHHVKMAEKHCYTGEMDTDHRVIMVIEPERVTFRLR